MPQREPPSAMPQREPPSAEQQQTITSRAINLFGTMLAPAVAIIGAGAVVVGIYTGAFVIGNIASEYVKKHSEGWRNSFNDFRAGIKEKYQDFKEDRSNRQFDRKEQIEKNQADMIRDKSQRKNIEVIKKDFISSAKELDLKDIDKKDSYSKAREFFSIYGKDDNKLESADKETLKEFLKEHCSKNKDSRDINKLKDLPDKDLISLAKDVKKIVDKKREFSELKEKTFKDKDINGLQKIQTFFRHSGRSFLEKNINPEQDDKKTHDEFKKENKEFCQMYSGLSYDEKLNLSSEVHKLIIVAEKAKEEDKKKAEEKARKEVEEKARKEAEEKAKKEAEDKARKADEDIKKFEKESIKATAREVLDKISKKEIVSAELVVVSGGNFVYNNDKASPQNNDQEEIEKLEKIKKQIESIKKGGLFKKIFNRPDKETNDLINSIKDADKEFYENLKKSNNAKEILKELIDEKITNLNKKPFIESAQQYEPEKSDKKDSHINAESVVKEHEKQLKGDAKVELDENSKEKLQQFIKEHCGGQQGAESEEKLNKLGDKDLLSLAKDVLDKVNPKIEVKKQVEEKAKKEAEDKARKEAEEKKAEIQNIKKSFKDSANKYDPIDSEKKASHSNAENIVSTLSEYLKKDNTATELDETIKNDLKQFIKEHCGGQQGAESEEKLNKLGDKDLLSLAKDVLDIVNPKIEVKKEAEEKARKEAEENDKKEAEKKVVEEKAKKFVPQPTETLESLNSKLGLLKENVDESNRDEFIKNLQVFCKNQQAQDSVQNEIDFSKFTNPELKELGKKVSESLNQEELKKFTKDKVLENIKLDLQKLDVGNESDVDKLFNFRSFLNEVTFFGDKPKDLTKEAGNLRDTQYPNLPEVKFDEKNSEKNSEKDSEIDSKKIKELKEIVTNKVIEVGKSPSTSPAPTIAQNAQSDKKFERVGGGKPSPLATSPRAGSFATSVQTRGPQGGGRF
jgi:hypothetical protein